MAITTRLVDTVTAAILPRAVQSGKIDPQRLMTHRCSHDRILDGYDTFARAASSGRSGY
jgi:alcohol dehydrogenase